MNIKPWSHDLDVSDTGFQTCDFQVHVVGFPQECFTATVTCIGDVFGKGLELEIREYASLKLRIFRI